jgi:hypothetical protein
VRHASRICTWIFDSVKISQRTNNTRRVYALFIYSILFKVIQHMWLCRHLLKQMSKRRNQAHTETHSRINQSINTKTKKTLNTNEILPQRWVAPIRAMKPTSTDKQIKNKMQNKIEKKRKHIQMTHTRE